MNNIKGLFSHKNKLIESAATLVGCTIGAGVLGIPYVVRKSGFIIGLLDMFIIFVLFLTLNLMLGEISLSTKKTHQLSGYLEKYVGKTGKLLMTLALIISIMGAMFAYLIATGNFLSVLINNSLKYSSVYSILFFAIVGIIIYLGLESVEESELWMMYIFIFAIIIIFALSIPHINIENLTTWHLSNLFYPYGVLLFAFLGLPVISEVREEVKGEEKILKKSIILGTTIPLILYIMFVIAIVGIAGANTTQTAILNLRVLGKVVEDLGLIFGITTMATTFIALGLAMMDIYTYDFGVKKFNSWILTLTPPLLLFLFGTHNFTNVLSITGAVSGGIMGLLVIWAYYNLKRLKKVERKSEYSLNIKPWILYLMALFLIVGVIYQIVLIV